MDLDSESWEVDFFPFVSKKPGGGVVLEELPIQQGTRGDREDLGEAGSPWRPQELGSGWKG